MQDDVIRKARSNGDNGVFSRLALVQKQRLLEAFKKFCHPGGIVLDIGLEEDSTSRAINSLTGVAECKNFSHVTMHGMRLANTPSNRNKKLSGSFKLPYADGEFDWACSNGVIEHMVNADNQFNLVREMARVAKVGVFVATPNRRHPVNFSNAPRSQMLRAQDLYRFASLLPGKPAYDVGHKRVFGIKAHFFLMISKI